MYFAEIGTPKAAERCESILMHMKNLSRSRPELQPDEISYSCAMSAWARSKSPDSADRMWKLYERIAEERFEPDLITCSQLLSILSKSKRREDLLKADEILTAMEKGQNPGVPNSLHYTEVMVRSMENHTAHPIVDDSQFGRRVNCFFASHHP